MTSQARHRSVASSRMTGRHVRMRSLDPLWRLRHVGYPVSPRGYPGLPASAFSLPWPAARDCLLVRGELLLKLLWGADEFLGNESANGNYST